MSHCTHPAGRGWRGRCPATPCPGRRLAVWGLALLLAGRFLSSAISSAGEVTRRPGDQLISQALRIDTPDFTLHGRLELWSLAPFRGDVTLATVRGDPQRVARAFSAWSDLPARIAAHLTSRTLEISGLSLSLDDEEARLTVARFALDQGEGTGLTAHHRQGEGWRVTLDEARFREPPVRLAGVPPVTGLLLQGLEVQGERSSGWGSVQRAELVESRWQGVAASWQAGAGEGAADRWNASAQQGEGELARLWQLARAWPGVGGSLQQTLKAAGVQRFEPTGRLLVTAAGLRGERHPGGVVTVTGGEGAVVVEGGGVDYVAPVAGGRPRLGHFAWNPLQIQLAMAGEQPTLTAHQPPLGQWPPAIRTLLKEMGIDLISAPPVFVEFVMSALDGHHLMPGFCYGNRPCCAHVSSNECMD